MVHVDISASSLIKNLLYKELTLQNPLTRGHLGPMYTANLSGLDFDLDWSLFIQIFSKNLIEYMPG